MSQYIIIVENVTESDTCPEVSNNCYKEELINIHKQDTTTHT
jgi:hypothetical protein